MITIVNLAIEARTDRVCGTAVLQGDTREELDRIIDLCEIVGTPEESLGGGFFVHIPLSAINRLLTALGQQED